MLDLHLLPLASFESVFPFIGLTGIFVIIPVVGILTRHQQKMAMILNNPNRQTQPSQTEQQILAELSNLRQLVNQQSIAIDDVAAKQRSLAQRAEVDTVAQRL